MQIRRLFFVYLSALALLFASVAASMVLTEMSAQQLLDDGRNINVSGRQRMLSQRIIYLAQDLNVTTDQTADSAAIRTELLSAIQELESAIDTFLTSHTTLSGTEPLPEPRRRLYFGDTGGTGSLDERVRLYTQLARQIAADPQDEAALAGLIEIERAGLLDDLDAVVSNFEAASATRLAQLRRYEGYAMVTALLLVCFEIVFVFRPGHALIQRSLDNLQTRNQELEMAHAQLDAQNKTLRRQTTSLRRAYAESEKLRKEQADFTYSVSHDLKSPANTIHLSLNEIKASYGRDLNADGQELLGVALGTVRRMGDQIEDILQYAWATDERTPPEDINLNTCILNIKTDLSAVIEATNATVTHDPLPEIFAHKTQIKILLKNLMSNALKYHAQGQAPVVKISAHHLPLDNGIVLSVTDNGIGIPEKDFDKIFNLFHRLHVRETYPGTGLGLSTCMRIAKNHGGGISVSSELGNGSRFDVILYAPKAKPFLPKLEVAA